MKTIIYVGAVLMAGASVYGIVDYKKASRKNEFTNMYEPGKEEKKLRQEKTDLVTEPVEKINNEKMELNTSEMKKSSENGSDVKSKKKLNHKLYSRAALDEEYMEKDLKLEEAKPEIKKTEIKKQ